MRNAFADQLNLIAKKDKRICILSGDIGNRLFDSFKQSNRSNFFNCGIAESNMISVASGLSQFGYIPFVYTITPFVTSRCLEQIKLDVAYHNSNVVIVGTGSGLSYSELGPTHHSFEDIAILRAIPNLRIFAPADATELRMCINSIVEKPSPSYIRIGKKDEPIIPKSSNKFKIGKIKIIKKGSKVLLLSTGTISSQVIQAANIIETKIGIQVEVAHAPTIKPFDINFFKLNTNKYDYIFSIEEHSIIGGLASCVSECITKLKINKIHFTPLALKDTFLHYSIKQKKAQEFHSIDTQSIVKRVIKIIK